MYAALAIARDAYGVTEIDGDALQTYYHKPGSSGSVSDPLNQVGSLGWKVTFTSELLNQAWLVRIESGATP